MTDERLFSEQELAEMGARTLDLLLEAIDAGDNDKAKALAQRMKNEFNYLHDGYMFWVAGLQTYIYKNFGVVAVEEAERLAHTAEAKVVFKPLDKVDLRSQVEHTAGVLRGHMQPITIVETDETIKLSMQPCGSGERIIQMGGYSPEVDLARVAEPHRITWGMRDFPIYCVHCPVTEMLAVERNGNFTRVKVMPDPQCPGGCEYTFYKNPENIPEEFYARVGREKDASSHPADRREDEQG